MSKHFAHYRHKSAEVILLPATHIMSGQQSLVSIGCNLPINIGMVLSDASAMWTSMLLVATPIRCLVCVGVVMSSRVHHDAIRVPVNIHDRQVTSVL